MAGKERKSTVTRQLNKESQAENEKVLANDKKTRGRKVVKPVAQPSKRFPRRKKTESPAQEPADEVKPTTPQRNRKQFLEKELEDILENATGRNTPLDSCLFLPKSRREQEDDTLSVRSFSTLLRARRGADKEVEDDTISLRSVKVKKEEEDTMSISSVKSGRKAVKVKADVAKVKKAVGRAKKVGPANENKATKPPKKSVKTKETTTKTTKKTALRLHNKIGAKRIKSTLLLKKKVRNAKIAVKRIYKRKAALSEKALTVAADAAVLVGKEPPTVMKVETVEIKEEIIEEAQLPLSVETTVPVEEVNGELTDGAPKAAVGKRKRQARQKPTPIPKPVNANGDKPEKPARASRKRLMTGIHFETTRSPEDSSVIIVQPRLGPKVRRSDQAAGNQQKSVPETPQVVPVVNGPSTTTSSSGNSTPYFIQTVPNLNALKSQPTAQGDWLVTPSGVVLIQAVSTSERNTHSEVSPAVAPVETQAPPIVNGSATALTCSAAVPSPLPSPLGGSASSSLPAQTSAVAVALVEPPVNTVLSGVAIAPSPSPSGAAVPDSMLSEKAKEAETTQTTALPRIPVAKNVHDLLKLKSKLEEAAAAIPSDAKHSRKPEGKNIVINRKNSGRRASHDCSFGPLPSRLLRRAGSCDRAVIKAMKNAQQIEKIVLTAPITHTETDPSTSQSASTETFPVIASSPKIESTEETSPSNEDDVAKNLNGDSAEPAANENDHPLTDDVSKVLDDDVSKCDTDSANAVDDLVKIAVDEVEDDIAKAGQDATMVVDEPEQETAPDDIEMKDVELPATSLVENIENVNELTPDSKEASNEAKVPSMPTIKDVFSLSASTTSTSRSAGRTKKYSRSLDSRQTLLPNIRRRSHPEPRVINIVTSEDGSRQGPTLAEELRQKYTSSSAVEPPPYPERADPQVPSSSTLPIIADPIGPASEEDLASKRAILSALGLHSLQEAAQMAIRKREQKQQAALSVANNTSSYTGTLKTVIKIQRPEKKGNGRMIYKASSSSGAVPVSETSADHGEDAHSSNPSPPTKESQESGDDEAKNGKAKSLVIPEKASSFSIHPHRMCSDVCTYCFGKFGLLDTPCHIAQLKDSEKRRNILDTETHLTADSCLCDACFRHVDKKSNGQQENKRKLLSSKQVRCSVVDCDSDADHTVRRKCLLKIKKSLGKRITLDHNKLDKVQPANIALCNRHHYWFAYFMTCGLCSRRLNSLHMYRIGPEITQLNELLVADSVPVQLTEKRYLCKWCHCYSTIRLKTKDPSEMSNSQRQFFESCQKRIQRAHGMNLPNSDPEGDGGVEGQDKKSKQRKVLKPSSTVTNGATETDSETISHATKNSSATEELSDLRAKFQLHSPPDKGFQKCTNTIQFTKETKDLFYELQRPYGNHSSFFRHLVLLEKYFRKGDLVLSRKADPQTVKYINGVHNRLRSYEGSPTPLNRPFTLTPVASTSSAAASTPTSQPQAAQPPPPPPPKPPTPPPPSLQANPLSQLQSTVHSIGLKPEISITTVGSSAEPRKLTPKIQENLRALANRASKPAGQTRAVILNRTVGGQKQSLVQVTTGGKTIHLTLSQFRRIQQMQLRKKQYLESQAKTKAAKTKSNGPGSTSGGGIISESVDVSTAFPHIPKALSVSVTKVPAVDLTQSPNRPD